MSRTYNELSQNVVLVEPKDSTGAATIPTTAEYRVDDCRSKKQMVGWTTLTPAILMTITIPGTINTIINSDRSTPEVKTVTVRIDTGLTTQHFASYTYRLQDLNFAQVT